MDVPPVGGFNQDEYKTNKLVLRRIEPGTFVMGDSYYADGTYGNPPHQVTLTRPYYIGLFEVTQRQYLLVKGSNPSSQKGNMRPVEKVSWCDVRGDTHESLFSTPSSVYDDSFVGRIRIKTGLAFDLPTEAQWEYACRAGTTSRYNNGGNTSGDLLLLGRCFSNRSDNKGGFSSMHTSVGSYLANDWGLYDMHGNVWEMCLDWVGELSEDDTDPIGVYSNQYHPLDSGPSGSVGRVCRGGSYGQDASGCGSASRYSIFETNQYPAYGFRLSLTLQTTMGQ
jgi:formylglycine-generating enzyme required for sulfatase activity